jgi:hypothetical protein
MVQLEMSYLNFIEGNSKIIKSGDLLSKNVGYARKAL